MKLEKKESLEPLENFPTLTLASTSRTLSTTSPGKTAGLAPAIHEKLFTIAANTTKYSISRTWFTQILESAAVQQWKIIWGKRLITTVTIGRLIRNGTIGARFGVNNFTSMTAITCLRVIPTIMIITLTEAFSSIKISARVSTRSLGIIMLLMSTTSPSVHPCTRPPVSFHGSQLSITQVQACTKYQQSLMRSRSLELSSIQPIRVGATCACSAMIPAPTLTTALVRLTTSSSAMVPLFPQLNCAHSSTRASKSFQSRQPLRRHPLRTTNGKSVLKWDPMPTSIKSRWAIRSNLSGKIATSSH